MNKTIWWAPWIVFFILFTGCVTTKKLALDSKPQEVVLTVKSSTDDQALILGTEQIHRSMEVDNPEGSLSNISCLINGVGHIDIFSGLTVSDVRKVHKDLLVLQDMGIKKALVFINSPGGDAFSGLAITDEIERAKKAGMQIVGYASGVVASAAVPVFAICDPGYAAPGTIFMVHETSLWKWPGRETHSDIKAQNQLMELLREMYIGRLAEHSDLSFNDWAAMEGKTTWFSAQQAFEFGLVDEIR